MNIRKILVISILVLVGIWLAAFGWRWWHGGYVIITAPDKNYTLRIENESGHEIAKVQSDRLKRRLNRGQYSVFAESEDGSSSKVVNIVARQSTNVDFKPDQVKAALKIAPSPAAELSFAGENVAYLMPDAQTARIFKVSSGQSEPFLDNLIGITNMQFNGGNFGVVSTNNGGLFEVVGLQESSVNSAFFAKPNPTQRIALGVTGNNYALSTGKDVFIKKPADIVANKVFTGQRDNAGIAYDGENRLAIYYTPPGYPFTEHEDEKETEVNYAGYQGSGINIVNLTNKEKTTLDEERIVLNAAWSPNGQQLLYALDSTIKIYDVGQKSTVAAIEKKQLESTHMAWCSDTIVAYADTIGVWLYDTGSNQSRLLTKVNDVSGIACNKRALYFGTFKPPADGNLYFIQLEGELNEKLLKQISTALPHSTNHYDISATIRNSKKPLVLIDTHAPTPLPGLDYSKVSDGKTFEQLTQQYRDEAIEYLKESGIDLNDIDIQFSSP